MVILIIMIISITGLRLLVGLQEGCQQKLAVAPRIMFCHDLELLWKSGNKKY